MDDEKAKKMNPEEALDFFRDELRSVLADLTNLVEYADGARKEGQEMTLRTRADALTTVALVAPGLDERDRAVIPIISALLMAMAHDLQILCVFRAKAAKAGGPLRPWGDWDLVARRERVRAVRDSVTAMAEPYVAVSDWEDFLS